MCKCVRWLFSLTSFPSSWTGRMKLFSCPYNGRLFLFFWVGTLIPRWHSLIFHWYNFLGEPPHSWKHKHMFVCVCVCKLAPGPLMSGDWNSSAVSSAAPCRPVRCGFCPVSGRWPTPSLASLACYNEVGMLGMRECILLCTPQLPTSNLLSTFCTPTLPTAIPSPHIPSSHLT